MEGVWEMPCIKSAQFLRLLLKWLFSILSRAVFPHCFYFLLFFRVPLSCLDTLLALLLSSRGLGLFSAKKWGFNKGDCRKMLLGSLGVTLS